MCKLNMEKTYNQVNWSFLDYMLRRMSFGDKWCRWINSCITITSFAVLMNGGRLSFFKVSRGLRHGDPLSLFLLIVVMEVLNNFLQRARELELFKGLKVIGGKHTEEVIYLFFVDDTLVFYKAD